MGLTRCSFTWPHFGVRQLADRKILQCSLYISATSTPRRKALPRSSSSTLRAIMISQEVDLVAGDFNGTAWRHRGKDNLSIVDEASMDSILPTPPGPTPLWGPGSIPDNGADVRGFLKPPGSQRSWKVNTICCKIITVLTRYRANCFGINMKL